VFDGPEEERVERYHWSRLNSHQVGRFAEYFVKMEFALYAFEVYTAEVDDRGIDFVARHGSSGFYEVQVKSLRNAKYAFMPKAHFKLRSDRLLALVLLEEEHAPDLYLIPATAWLTPNALLVDRNYDGLKSKPEWGVQLSGATRPLLESYRFQSAILPFCSGGDRLPGNVNGEP
jgi:hypothetical protein